MKEFFVIALTIVMLFGFGFEMNYTETLGLPLWADLMIHPQSNSAVNLTCEPLYQFLKSHVLPIYNSVLSIAK